MFIHTNAKVVIDFLFQIFFVNKILKERQMLLS